MELHNIYNGKTVLVTGASGLIGSNLVNRIMGNESVNMIVVGRSKYKLEQVFSQHASKNNFHIVEHDINMPLPQTVGQVDYLYHAASPISGETIQNEPVSVVSTNLCGVLNCLDYLKVQKEKTDVVGTLIVFSSATVYGKTKEGDEIANETDTQLADALDHPNAPYSEAKRMVEVVARAYNKQYGIDVKIARFSYIYGYTAVPPKTAFYSFIGKALEGQDLVFRKSGFARRDNIYIDDAIEGLLYVTEYGNGGEAYNISACQDGGNFAAIDEMAECIAKAAGNGVKVVVAPSDGRAGGIALGNEKLKALGWSVKTSLEEGIAYIYNRYKQK